MEHNINYNLDDYIIEYDIVEHCNLNCRNCGHFSMLKEEREKSIDEICNELTLLKGRINVKYFRILGGEPLLHSNIIGVMTTIRRILGKECRIELSTNGIKLITISESFFIFAKILDINIVVSRFPISIDYSKAEERLKKSGIKYVIEDRINFWNPLDPTGGQNPDESFYLCRKIMKWHALPYDGKFLYLCCWMPNIPFLNKKFGYTIEEEKISVLKSDKEILTYLSKPCASCKYCKCVKHPEPWQLHKHE